MHGISIPEKCKRCQKFSPAAEFVGAGHGRYCWSCYEKHLAVIATIQGKTECCDCQVKLIGDRPGVKLACRLVPKDGVYQLLCEPCFQRWVLLTPAMFRGTPFGKAMNL